MSGRPEVLATTPSREAASPEADLMHDPAPLPLADTPRDPTGTVFEKRLHPVGILDEYEELVFWEHRAAECEEPLIPFGGELDEWALAYRAKTATRLRGWAAERRPLLMAAVRQFEMPEIADLLHDAPNGLLELAIAALADPRA